MTDMNHTYRDLTSPLDTPEDSLRAEVERLLTYWRGRALIDAANKVTDLAFKIAMDKIHHEIDDE